MISVEANQAQLRAVIARLDSRLAVVRVRAGMEESLAYLQGVVREGMSVDTGLGRGSVTTDLRGTRVDSLRGRVFSPLPHVLVMEEGRQPGAAMPPVAVIARWMERKGIEGDAFLMARSIGRKGITGRHMFREAAEKGLPTVLNIVARHLKGL